MKFISFLILSFFIFLPHNAPAIVVVGYEAEPFYFNNGTEGISGACFEIIKKLCELQHHSCEFKIASIDTMLDMLENGKADLACPLPLNEKELASLVYGEKLFKTKFSFFGLPRDAKKIKSPKDMKLYSVSVFGLTSSSGVFKELEKKIGPVGNIIPETTELNSLLKAEKVGKSLAYINRDIALCWIQKSKSPLKEIPLEVIEMDYYIGYSKKNLTMEQISSFEKILKNLRLEKFLTKVSEKYQVKIYEDNTSDASPDVVTPAATTPPTSDSPNVLGPSEKKEASQ